jgi:hypothetical protein
MNALTLNDLVAAGLPTFDLAVSGTPNRPRASAPKGVIVHTPGTPFAQRAWMTAQAANGGKKPALAEFDRAAARRFDAAQFQPGYLLGQTGAVFILESDAKRTNHAGKLGGDSPVPNVYASGAWRDWASPSDGSGWQKHGRPGHQVYDFWDAAWPGAVTPLEVYPWRDAPNDCIGIDLLPDPNTGEYTPAQRSAFVRLVRLLSQAHGFPLDARHVTTHTLASPVERGTVKRNTKIIGRHWDPDARVWPHAEVLAELVS